MANLDVTEILGTKPDPNIPLEDQEVKPLPFKDFIEFIRYTYLVPPQTLETVVFHQKQKNLELQNVAKVNFDQLNKRMTEKFASLDDNIKSVDDQINKKLLDYDQEVESKIDQVTTTIDELEGKLDQEKEEAVKTNQRIEETKEKSLNNIEKLQNWLTQLSKSIKATEDNLGKMLEDNKASIMKDIEQIKKDNPYPNQEEVKKPKAPIKYPSKILGKKDGEGGSSDNFSKAQTKMLEAMLTKLRSQILAQMQ